MRSNSTPASRRGWLLIIAVPVALAAAFLLVEWLTHSLTGDPWLDTPHLITAGILSLVSFAILLAHQRTLNQRAQARSVLTSREASYRALFDQFPEPVTVWSGDGVLLMQNLVSARNMGGTREDFVGTSIIEMFGEEAGRGYLQRIQRVFQTGVTEEQEDEVPIPMGVRQFWTTMQRVRQPDGEDAVQVISYDITERVRVEQAWHAEEERASTYLNLAPVVVIALDMEGKVTLINAAGCKVVGCTEAEVLGKSWFDTFVPERVREQVRNDYIRLAPTVQGFAPIYENPVLSKTGEERLIAWHPVVFRDRDGTLIGTLSSGEDITERRRAEDALRASETLRIRERSALEERQKLARELHDSVSQALYGIALGVNTALTVLDRNRDAAREALEYSIGLARAGLSEMRALIFELRPESLESEGLVAALLKTAEAARARFELPVSVELCGEPDLPLAAKEAVYRIAQEAFHNAIKHAQSREISVQLTCDDERLMLAVRDDGIGFDPEMPYPGHLGLKSMRERAASIGGSLSINSAPGRGTLVRLEAPLGTGYKQDVTRAEASAPASHSSGFTLQ